MVNAEEAEVVNEAIDEAVPMPPEPDIKRATYMLQAIIRRFGTLRGCWSQRETVEHAIMDDMWSTIVNAHAMLNPEETE